MKDVSEPSCVVGVRFWCKLANISPRRWTACGVRTDSFLPMLFALLTFWRRGISYYLRLEGILGSLASRTVHGIMGSGFQIVKFHRCGFRKISSLFNQWGWDG